MWNKSLTRSPRLFTDTKEWAMNGQATATGTQLRTAQTDASSAVWRAIDITVSALGLAWLLPVMLLISIAVLCEGGRPIFFWQKRLGKDGRTFRLYKFRKFGAKVTGGLSLTMRDDPRLTRVGWLLERSKLDELPQLWNVLAGDMSLVGPRPESLSFADCFQGAYRRLLDHRPGIFGPAQTMFRNEAAFYPPLEDPETVYREVLFPAKAVLDLSYYPTRTVSKDLAWICRGVLAVVTGLSHRPQRLGEDLGRASSP
jgi:lipopolysaccharide/colanic/teichoic acid biosynthesis glycosyltransferase